MDAVQTKLGLRVYTGSTLLVSQWLLDFVSRFSNRVAICAILLIVSSGLHQIEMLLASLARSDSSTTKRSDDSSSVPPADLTELGHVGHALLETTIYLLIQYCLSFVYTIDLDRLPVNNCVALGIVVFALGYSLQRQLRRQQR